MKIFSLIVIIVVGATSALAQREFLITDASKLFDVKISGAKCEGWVCGGSATYRVLQKSDSRLLLRIRLAETRFYIGETPDTSNQVREAVYFGDFNFDGREDIAICDGNHAAYGFPSYRVYLFDRGSFELNRQLSRIAQTRLGMFKIESSKKQLETFNKSGCCYYVTERYSIIRNRPIKVYELIEDGTGLSGRLKKTTRKLIKGKWRSRVDYE